MRDAPVAAPRHGQRVVEAMLGDELALFHLDTRRLHLLNGSAAAIWDELGTATTIADVAVGIGDRFAMDPQRIRGDVEQTVEQLRADGLLVADDRNVVSEHGADGWIAPTRGVVAPESGSYAALDARVGIVCDDAEIVATVDRVLRPLRCEDQPGVTIDVTTLNESSWTIAVGGSEKVALNSRLSVALRMIGEINNLAVASVPDDLVFHAGAVSDGRHAVLLPAASNHGKSTLTTALVAGGLAYLTDEAAAITAELSLRPFAKSIALDPGSFSLFDSLSPAAVDEPLAQAMACREWHIDPRTIGDIGELVPVGAIVCPHWRAGASTRLTRVPPIEALHLLLAETFDFAVGGQKLFERLVRLVDTVPVFRLGYGDLEEAATMVRSILIDPSAP